MDRVILIGSGVALSRPLFVCQQLSLGVEVDEFDPHEDFGRFEGIMKKSASLPVFVALSPVYLNLGRSIFLKKARLARLKLVNLISPDAVVSKSCQLGENVLVDQDVIIKSGVTLGDGVYLGRGVELGSDVKIRNYAWIEDGARIGNGADFGSCSILGKGAILGSISVGARCELSAAKSYLEDITALEHHLPGNRTSIKFFT